MSAKNTNNNTAQVSSHLPVETVQDSISKVEDNGNLPLENSNLSQNLQDMELDINSMPVIIGDEDFIETEQQPKQNLISIQPKYSESIVISPKSNTASVNKTESVIMHLGESSTSSQNLQSIITIPSKSAKSSSKGVKSQRNTSKTIKLPAGALKNLQKGGNQQVLILKTAGGQIKSDKGVVQRPKGPLNMFQHGNKILIVNNPQMAGQNKIKLNPQQQQLLTGGKLAPGTRVITSKVVATTAAQGSVNPSKTSTSKASSKSTQNLIIGKGGLLSTSKNVIINSSTGKLMTAVPGPHTITSKGQTIITQNILSSKGGLILPCSSQNSPGSKTPTIITSTALSPGKNMIVTPITRKGGTIISGNQKLRIVSSKAPLSGTRVVFQNPQGKIAVDPQHKSQQLKLSGVRGQPSSNTILIQTSQGIIAKSINSSTCTTTSQSRVAAIAKTVIATLPTQAKLQPSTQSAQIVHQANTVQHSQIVQQTQLIQSPQVLQQTQIVQKPLTVRQTKAAQQTASVKKVTIPKVRQGPNILQKSQRKSTPRTPKASANRLISPAVSASEQIILSAATNFTGVVQPTLVQGQSSQNSDGLVYLTVDESGNYRQLDNKSLVTFEGNSTEAPQTIFIPADNRSQDVGSIFLAIDDAGNIINISQPAVSAPFTSENSAPSQDILAKALANTQVLQQETIIPDIDVSAALSSSHMDSTILASSSFSEQANYPAPSLSHSVLETSLTLNQPIMTPLEVPSAVSPNISQLTSLPPNFISSNLLSTKQKHLRPSMPLLTEESLANQAGSESVFLLDSSNNIIPTSSGSQISFQLTLDENNVIMTSGTTGAVLPSSYQVVAGNLLASSSQLVASGEPNSSQKLHSFKSESAEGQSENISYILSHSEEVSSEIAQTAHHSDILREALETPQTSFKSEEYLTGDDDVSARNSADDSNQGKVEFDSKIEHFEKIGMCESEPEQVNVSFNSHGDDPLKMEEEMKHSLKRNPGEEAVTSSSDLEDGSEKIEIHER